MKITVNDLNMCIFLHETPAKADKKGLYPLKVQLDVNGERLQFTIPKTRIFPAHWDSKARRVNTFAPDSTYINVVLDNLEDKFNKVRLDAEQAGEPLTGQQVRDRIVFFDAYVRAEMNIFDMITKYLSFNQARFEAKLIAYSTYRLKKTLAKVWCKFLRRQGISRISQVTKSTQDYLGLFVMNNTKGTVNRHNYACYTVYGFKHFLNFCLDNEWIDKNPFTRRTWKLKKTGKVYLSSEELNKICELNLADSPRLEKTRDCFLFACSTGLSFSDLACVEQSHVLNLDNPYLLVQRQKTGLKGCVPLLPEAYTILKKYAFKLPLGCNQTYNNHLKELYQWAEIGKHITSHVGRKTFANQMLNEYNLPLETVSAMLCHTEVNTTKKYYAEVTLQKICANTKHLFFTPKPTFQTL